MASKRYLELLKQMEELHIKKNAGYAGVSPLRAYLSKGVRMIGICDGCKKIKFLNEYHLCRLCQNLSNEVKDSRFQPHTKALQRRPIEKRYHPAPPPPVRSRGPYEDR